MESSRATPRAPIGRSSASASALHSTPHSARRVTRPGWSPPKTAMEKDQLIEKLVHDNEVLMKEVAELDAQLRQALGEREATASANAALLKEQHERQSANEISERLLQSMDAQVNMIRSERDEHNRQHAADKEYLQQIFMQLEAQLALARTEREELQSRADRERRASGRRIKELEDSLAVAIAGKERVREACDREKEVLAKQFEQRVAGMRLEKEQSKVDKTLLRRLEKELAELKSLSTSVLGPLAARDPNPTAALDSNLEAMEGSLGWSPGGTSGAADAAAAKTSPPGSAGAAERKAWR